MTDNKQRVLKIIDECHGVLLDLRSVSHKMWGLAGETSLVSPFKETMIYEELDRAKDIVFTIYRHLQKAMHEKFPEHSSIGCNCDE